MIPDGFHFHGQMHWLQQWPYEAEQAYQCNLQPGIQISLNDNSDVHFYLNARILTAAQLLIIQIFKNATVATYHLTRSCNMLCCMPVYRPPICPWPRHLMAITICNNYVHIAYNMTIKYDGKFETFSDSRGSIMMMKIYEKQQGFLSN